MADDDLATEAKLGGDSKRAVDAGRGAMDIDDLAGEEDPPKRPGRGRATTPGVTAGLGDPEETAGVATLFPCPVKDAITG